MLKLRTCLITGCLLLFAPAVAHAAPLDTLDVVSGVLVVAADPNQGYSHDIAVNGSGASVHLFDNVSGLYITISATASAAPWNCVHGATQNDVTCTPDAGTSFSSVSLTGGHLADTITGTTLSVPMSIDGADGGDHVTGGAAADRVVGGLGDDTLDGGAGDDVLVGGVGADSLAGGAGNDAASYESELAGVQVTLGATAQASSGTDQLGADVEDVTGSAYADTITGTAGANHIDGGAGDDSIDGGEGGDELLGGAGNDTIAARDGSADAVGCGSGVDVVTDDWRDVAARDCEFTTSTAAPQPTPPADPTKLPTGGDDTLVGSAGNDIFRGLGGDDVIDGRAGNDRLFGGTGADLLRGGLGNDRLDGGAGDDLLAGGRGKDTYIGGVGNDLAYARDGVRGEVINCGAGADVVIADLGDRPNANCEAVLFYKGSRLVARR
jgi:Ca2+-binding RTX toxin-like protein